MTQATFVRELFEIPERVHQGDYVLKLTEGLQNPEETAGLYVTTPKLIDAFDRALGLVGDALKSGQSKATYLHGSFGSGKSHFMAMLSLLLQGHEAAWRQGDFHPLREKYPFAGKKKLLELHFHMIGAETLESKLFGTYIAHVQAQHPDAALPGLFADEVLFEDARKLLERLGEAEFFAQIAGPKAGWGPHGAGWNLERFEHHAASSDPAEREKLFSVLVKTWYRAYLGQGQFVDLDSGLQILTRHAADLGYGGVVLFLDELILWLSHRASERGWLNRETEKMIKLVEAQQSERAIPIISFVARQRALDEMVGKMYTGQDERILNDLLNHAQGRFDTITLEDKNLPAIVEKRILKTKSEGAKAQLDAAFAQLQRTAGKSWNTLMGSEDPAAFRKLYPFSPALVDALVALSNSLQRQRTAIKLLVEILSEHITDLKVGETVRVGDLFDVLAGGDEPTDGVMRMRFQSAKQLYQYQFLPVLQEAHGTTTGEKCQRLRADHRLSLGCSGCPNKPCRADNRLIKTLIIAALVPEVAVLKDLTVSQLIQLNHGTVISVVPGAEAATIAQKLRVWGAQNLPLHIGSGSDPDVRVRLEGVDIKPILEKYSAEDSMGSRQRVLRRLLFDALGIEAVTDSGKDETVEWNETNRKGRIVFGNVRSLGVENLKCPDDQDFRLVVDYPFDEPGKTPNDDVHAVDQFLEQNNSWSLVWLPHFFSETINRLLGDYVVLEHIFSSSDVQRQAVAHLGVDDQTRAINDLNSQRNQKKNRILEVIEQAYGLKTASDKDIDFSNRVDQHLMLLQPGAPRVQPALAANLASAKQAYIQALLEQRYPNHPKFTKVFSPSRVATILEKFGAILAVEEHRIGAEKGLSQELLGTLGALGLVRVTEGYVHLVEDKTLQMLENKRIAEGLEHPTVNEIRSWLDPKGLLGLQWQPEDVVVRCYAMWAKRTLTYGGKPYEPMQGKPLEGQANLSKPDMPEVTEWNAALGKAGACFGIALQGWHYCSPDNVVRLHGQLNKKLSEVAQQCAAMPSLIRKWNELVGLEGKTDRLATAESADQLCALLQGKSAADQVRALAKFEPKTSGTAIGSHTDKVKNNRPLLEDELLYGVFAQLCGLTSAESERIAEQASQALRQDEVNIELAARLKALAVAGQQVLSPKVSPIPPGTVKVAGNSDQANGKAITGLLKELTDAVAKEQAKNPEGLELVLTWKLLRKG